MSEHFSNSTPVLGKRKEMEISCKFPSPSNKKMDGICPRGLHNNCPTTVLSSCNANARGEQFQQQLCLTVCSHFTRFVTRTHLNVCVSIVLQQIVRGSIDPDKLREREKLPNTDSLSFISQKTRRSHSEACVFLQSSSSFFVRYRQRKEGDVKHLCDRKDSSTHTHLIAMLAAPLVSGGCGVQVMIA